MAGSAARTWIVLGWLAAFAAAGILRPAHAETAAPAPAGDHGATPDKLQKLRDLLNDPDVQATLAKRPAGSSDKAPAGTAPDTMAGNVGDDLQDFRNHVRQLAAGIPELDAEFGRARSMLVTTLGGREIVDLGLFIAAFVALGFGGEWLYSRAMRKWRTWLLALRLETTRERVVAVFARLFYGLGLILSYAIGSLGAVLLFDWPTLLKQILIGYLLASLAVRLAFVFGRFFLAPGAERFRVAPISTPAATFTFHHIGLAAVILAFGAQTISLLGSFGFSLVSRELSAHALGILLLAVALDAVWRYPHEADEPSEELTLEDLAHRRSLRMPRAIACSAILVLLWALWVVGTRTSFWLVVFAAGLPAATMVMKRSVRHILRPPEAAQAAHSDSRRLEVIFVERGIRSLLIIAAALLLSYLLGIDFASLTMDDTITTRVLRAVLGVVIVVLVADFLWHALTALVDRKLTVDLVAEVDDTGHAARLKTLLPILKNLLLAVIVVIAFMMVLAALGIQIGPLIASAGVVGVAIGFGAQTLVKDIISGIFYLIDDAFRIGEYIQSGSYKGTVESFSLRSVKLRHQRGALYTVPFGLLGAVQNLSRDWVVDKIKINVPYETDLDEVRKLIKKIGETLAQDPELGPDILKPIKLQGVAAFGDYAVQLQTKMMTKPGDVQFAARRRALAMIKQAFAANGIGFALPMVHVAGGGNGHEAAAAQAGLALLQGGKVDEAV